MHTTRAFSKTAGRLDYDSPSCLLTATDELTPRERPPYGQSSRHTVSQSLDYSKAKRRAGRHFGLEFLEAPVPILLGKQFRPTRKGQRTRDHRGPGASAGVAAGGSRLPTGGAGGGEAIVFSLLPPRLHPSMAGRSRRSSRSTHRPSGCSRGEGAASSAA